MRQPTLCFLLLALSTIQYIQSNTIGCKDIQTVSRCVYFKRQGYCSHKIYGHYMLKNCKETCKFCRDASAPPNIPRTAFKKCGQSLVSHSRIIAGKTATKGAWPWQAMLNKDGKPNCGASLISSQWIATAAHCVAGMQNDMHRFTIALGEHDWTVDDNITQKFDTIKIISHPRYRHRQSQDFDIALIKLKRPVIPNKHVNQVCLPGKGHTVNVGTNCVVTGWGKVTNPGRRHHILQQAQMVIAKSSVCDALVKANNWPFKVTRNMICAGDGGKTAVSTCSGDSGGPLVCPTGPSGAFELHGIVSWGSPDCNSKKSYSVFTRVSIMRQWIGSTISDN